MQGIIRIIFKSIKFYKIPVLYQILIIVLLSAVITGSLLTGESVRQSLKKTSSESLGNTGILISSGNRFFSPDLIQKMRNGSNISCTGLVELTGFCQNMNSQKGVVNAHIFAANKDFFAFQGSDSLSIKPGEVAVNIKLAQYLDLKKGDELIIRYSEINDIPADAPFAPDRKVKSVVMKIGAILEPEKVGNFSLLISQITPLNIFMDMNDLENDGHKINRILFKKDYKNSLIALYDTFKNNLTLKDIGFKIRTVKKTGKNELVSDRVFIDGTIADEISKVLPSSARVITYMGNHFKSGGRSTPYSFISGLPSALYPEIASGNGMIINRWMANDLGVKEGDAIQLYWYSPDSLNKLIEKNSHFIIKSIVDIKGIWADSLLMPDFPGISGKESCSDWDAGVPIKIHEIRKKDEDYWNRYRGTPKAFISYEKARELWGNNFGPATSFRFPIAVTVKDIENKINGSLDPYKVGFTITDIRAQSLKASESSVDFGSLFLSLGFFLILASLILLSFAASLYFDSKKRHINTLYALGFKNNRIFMLLFFESALINFAGCIIGAFGGFLANLLITGALNTVWNGAVQTNTLHPYFNIIPVLTGFVLTFLTIMVLMLIKIKRYLKVLHRKGIEIYNNHSGKKNLIILFISSYITISLLILSVLLNEQRMFFSLASGISLLLTCVLLWRQYYLGVSKRVQRKTETRRQFSRLYYSFNSSGAVTSILFIAAGIFTVFITEMNRMNFNEKAGNRSGGTGGYLLWCENTIPLKEDLNTDFARKSFGLDDTKLPGLRFVQMKRSSGNDASCLNLNHITTPPLLGTDPTDFINNKSFTFSKALKTEHLRNPWQYLKISPSSNVIYGIADQTVLDWGLKIKIGDTLMLRAENGMPLKIIIAAGLQSSVFQGNVLIGMEYFSKYFPSVSGSTVMLAEGKPESAELIRNTLNDRLENYGLSIEKTNNRLASFYTVSNTYLSIFAVFGVLGMIIGIIGLGFVLLRNFNERKKEFALMLAVGFKAAKIRRMILSEQLLILFAGVLSGILPAVVATSDSIMNHAKIPWMFMLFMVLALMITGSLVLSISVRSVTRKSLIGSLKKE
jgi:ABC-type antimicrobial peptide transport system permease subunit